MCNKLAFHCCEFASPGRRCLLTRVPSPCPACRSGRKRAALTYCVTYTIGCITKHFNNFWILFAGRVFCGVATSLLYSAFESWLVGEHFKVGWCCGCGWL